MQWQKAIKIEYFYREVLHRRLSPHNISGPSQGPGAQAEEQRPRPHGVQDQRRRGQQPPLRQGLWLRGRRTHEPAQEVCCMVAVVQKALSQETSAT